MNEFEDNSQTMEFDAVPEEPQTAKPQQNRSQSDAFTTARNGRGYEIYNKKEKGNGALIAIACILTVLLVVTIVVAIIILKSDSENNDDQLQNAGGIVNEQEETVPGEEEEVPEIQNNVISCNLVFYPETIEEADGVYTINADFFDQEMNLFENREVIISEETDIRQDGKRLAAEALVYIMENTAGDKIVFKGEIREEDGSAVAISFETPVEEEILEEEIEEEELPAEEETEEESPAPEEEPAVGEEPSTLPEEENQEGVMREEA